MTTNESILSRNLRPDAENMIVTTVGQQSLASLMRIVRRSRLGKVKRHGRKGSRIYYIKPRNVQEMPASTIRLMEWGKQIDAEANNQDR